MPGNLRLPILDALIPGGLDYGSLYLVEFEPQSLWYDTSLTIAAEAVKHGAKTDYHTLMHMPQDVRRRIADQGVDVEKAEEEGLFRITDSYTSPTGIDYPEGARKPRQSSLNLTDWAASEKRLIKEPTEGEKRWVHIDDDMSILLQYNEEKDFHRQRQLGVAWARTLELVLFQPIAIGVYSDSLYKQMESVCDGIIEFRTRDESGRVENYARARMIRGKTHESSWKRLKVHDNGGVTVETTREAGTSNPVTGVTESLRISGENIERQLDAPGALSLMLERLVTITLSRYRVVGNYTRFDDSARNLLKDLKQKIMAGLESSSKKHDNYLLWAPPGNSKTFFVRQIAENLKRTVRCYELNLAETREDKARYILSKFSETPGPSLCFIDEIDSKPAESWPYEILLGQLDRAVLNGRPRVFVLAGSSGGSLADMKIKMAVRTKGEDLLSRIPDGNEYELPPMSLEDKVLLTLASFRQAGLETGREVSEVEKLALYYIAQRHELRSARKLREFAARCVERMPVGEDRVKYDNMFSPGEQLNKEFWMEARSSNPQLINTYVHLED